MIAPFEPDQDPAKYIEHLRDIWRNAARHLRQPVQQWPAGDSHTISRNLQLEAQAIAMDMAVEYGIYDAYGRLTGYSR